MSLLLPFTWIWHHIRGKGVGALRGEVERKADRIKMKTKTKTETGESGRDRNTDR